ncbi:nucleoside 2-deoxyribosyltransferase domain-containing protein [Halorubrum distributum]|uniref:nucleoside 2-deoxyribosyltransferase domain-containing protein n=1 Tax=Halorubrum distributum TaxID=29283 RepID=UPI0012675A3C|nr:nucleoside 2-deoxyribosyltransferase domain-containing protein [Halorubrum litoreum]
MSVQPTEDYPRIYTAGAMRWQDSEDSWWRRSVEESLEEITFYHPEDAYFDHGGDFVQGAVSEDIQAINAADGVVAYFSETPQIGTLVETLHALHTDTPTLVLFDDDLIEAGVKDPDYPIPIESALYRATADDHWFLINYINGDDDRSGQRNIPGWISAWEGTPRGSVVGVETTAHIRQAVTEWTADEFSVEFE